MPCQCHASTKIIFNYFPDSEGERFQPRPAQDERRRRAVSSAGGDSDRLQLGVGDAAKGAGLLRGDTGARRALARRLPRAAVHHSNHGKKNNKKKKKSTAHAPMFQPSRAAVFKLVPLPAAAAADHGSVRDGVVGQHAVVGAPQGDLPVPAQPPERGRGVGAARGRRKLHAQHSSQLHRSQAARRGRRRRRRARHVVVVHAY